MIKVELMSSYFPIEFKHEGRTFDSIRIKSSKNQTLEIAVIKNNIPYCTIQKRMKLIEGKVLLSFGKKKLEIGSYSS